MVFKKDLVPIGRKGKVIVHRGKGSAERPMPVGAPRSRFPKPAPAPPDVGPMGPPAGPAGMMPPFGIGQPPEE